MGVAWSGYDTLSCAIWGVYDTIVLSESYTAGDNVSFWVGDTRLAILFPRPFSVAARPDASVADMGSLWQELFQWDVCSVMQMWKMFFTFSSRANLHIFFGSKS
ncbi:hypothetical protein RJT34_31313 [Clitoria ternatea]|uniref:Uncharacterized protein n=1 Tax=Clitoria ternatea TaxID=43366 RepID=A0AAN9EVA6_CLITE